MSTLRADKVVLCDCVPGNIEINVVHRRIAENRLQHRNMAADRDDDSPKTAVRPDDGTVGMMLQKRFHLAEIGGLGAFLWKGHVRVVVNQHNESGFGSKVKDSIKRWISE